jgi:hypothetical protein
MNSLPLHLGVSGGATQTMICRSSSAPAPFSNDTSGAILASVTDATSGQSKPGSSNLNGGIDDRRTE